jgi:hypothetical protein
MKRTSLMISMIIFLVGWQACKHEPGEIIDTGNPTTDPPPTGGEQACSADTVYFQNKILPLLISSCAKSNCHDAITQQDGVQLTSYQTIMNTADVVPGNPGASELWEVINETDPQDVMPQPPSAPLTAAEKDLIFRWIMQGAKNNACNDCDTTVFTYSGAVVPIINTYCKGCHNPSFLSAGLDLTDYNNVRGISLNGRLNGVINHLPGYQPMPRGGAKLSDCRITQIRKWIDAGSQQN